MTHCFQISGQIFAWFRSFLIDDDKALLSEGLATTLEAARAEIENLLSKDFAGSTWGDLHQTTLRHAVLSGISTLPSTWGELPSTPRAGSGDTVGLTGYDPTFNAVMGSSFRVVMDVGEWDSSQVINSPGQSGDPRSSHYADLYQKWGNDESFPLLFSREAIEQEAHFTIRLRPGKN